MELSRTDPSLYNSDLAPIPAEKRSWGTYNYASLWVAMSVCIPTYMLASGLIAGGMNASARSLWLVRNSGMDWRASRLFDVAHRVARRDQRPGLRLDLLFSFLGDQHDRYLARPRNY